MSSIPTLNDIVVENDERLTAILDDALSSCKKIPFMAIDSKESSEKIKGMYHYVLHLYGHLINGQKVLVTLMDIQIFFDILIPDRKSPDICETKARDILSNKMKTLKIKHIKTFSFAVIIEKKRHIYEFIQMVLVKEK